MFTNEKFQTQFHCECFVISYHFKKNLNISDKLPCSMFSTIKKRQF